MKNLILKFVLLASTTTILCSCIGLSFDRPKDTTTYRTIPMDKKVDKINGLNDALINVFEVRIPSYMARNQIVQLANANSSELLMSDNNIWAEPVQNAITRSIINYLSEITSSKDIQSTPVLTDGKNSLALKINILECIGSNNGSFNFKAQYSIVSSDKTVSNIFDFNSQSGSTYNDYVNAISTALKSLSLDICKKISEFNK